VWTRGTDAVTIVLDFVNSRRVGFNNIALDFVNSRRVGFNDIYIASSPTSLGYPGPFLACASTISTASRMSTTTSPIVSGLTPRPNGSPAATPSARFTILDKPSATALQQAVCSAVISAGCMLGTTSLPAISESALRSTPGVPAALGGPAQDATLSSTQLEFLEYGYGSVSVSPQRQRASKELGFSREKKFTNN
jgi:hypothetical protein